MGDAVVKAVLAFLERQASYQQLSHLSQAELAGLIFVRRNDAWHTFCDCCGKPVKHNWSSESSLGKGVANGHRNRPRHRAAGRARRRGLDSNAAKTKRRAARAVRP